MSTRNDNSNNRRNQNRRPQRNIPRWSVEEMALNGFTITDEGVEKIWTVAQDVLGITAKLDERFGKLEDGQEMPQPRRDHLRKLEKQHVGFRYRCWVTIERCIDALLEKARQDKRAGMDAWDADADFNRLTKYILRDERYFVPRGRKTKREQKKGGNEPYEQKKARQDGKRNAA